MVSVEQRAAEFNAFLHELRTQQLRRLPPGARTVLSGGCAGSLYFEWFGSNYPTPVERHIGIEAYTEKPHDLPPEVEWLQRTLGDLEPVATGEVDLVFAGEVFEHMWPDEITGFLAEANRVLRPGGHLVLDSPNRRATSALGWIHPEHTIEFTPAEATELLTLAGFEDVRVRGLWLCHDSVGGFLPVELDAGGAEWPRERRAAEAEERPDDAFVWWAEALRGDREADRRALDDRVHAIYATVRPLALDRLRSEVGSLEVCAAGTIVAAGEGEAGLLVRGPGIAMPPGRGSVTFWLGRPGAGTPGRGTELGSVELTSGGSVVASRPVAAADLDGGGRLSRVTLPYELEDTAFDSEFRVHSTGSERLAAALHVLVDEGNGRRSAPSQGLSAAWDDISLGEATPVTVDVARPAGGGASGVFRAVARFLLWPVRRFFDPRIQGVLAHTDARHRELLGRIEQLDARVQELSARVDELERRDD
jgi:SAM-dependent methyltransferase